MGLNDDYRYDEGDNCELVVQIVDWLSNYKESCSNQVKIMGEIKFIFMDRERKVIHSSEIDFMSQNFLYEFNWLIVPRLKFHVRKL